ncbi:hypothetical protein GGR92_003788 [Spirosoma lacussanchae]|uniref:PqqD family protein n=1 Tax=Spirosoma lacussanchae TaxID=1884249 RepID=UPI001108CCD2|nr:PqqD family protein [Spirosoma lacussanchae]
MTITVGSANKLLKSLSSVLLQVQTNQDEYIITGSIQSRDGDVTGFHSSYPGSTDYWVTKLNSSGALIWQKALGGREREDAVAIFSTADGGCIVAGSAESSTGDVTINLGYTDAWIVRLNGPNSTSCTTISNGSWNSTSTWSCGHIPISTDIVYLKHTVVIPDNYAAKARKLIYELPGALKLSNGARLQLSQ